MVKLLLVNIYITYTTIKKKGRGGEIIKPQKKNDYNFL